MKTLILFFVLTLAATSPLFAKGQQQGGQPSGGGQQVANPSISPSEAQVQADDSSDDSLTKVSDQVHALLETVGAKGGIGEQVRVIAQNQEKNEQEIKNNFQKLNSQNKLTKFLFGVNKNDTESLSQNIEQNQQLIQQLETLKLKTKNQSELEQLQQTIEQMVSQNTSLQDRLVEENRFKGIFAWLKGFFN